MRVQMIQHKVSFPAVGFSAALRLRTAIAA
jgi:hypothetical protein